ncbi:MAG: L-rhamnose isomerase [Kiritimatiellaeota bacterium]|nr:L-rhamnose isomerase [Kiritimatiellota bacterium]
MFPQLLDTAVEKNFQEAVEIYAGLGVDVAKVVETLEEIPVSMHCWQGDDVGGFEVSDQGLSGGIMATGDYPGKATSPDELRADAEKAFSLIPGLLRFNLHAIYLESGGKYVDRDVVAPEHFANWIGWAKERNVGLDFNPTFFSHPKAECGTLSSADPAIREFWIEHAKRCRTIAETFSKELDDTVVVNYWVPDGMKDLPADRWEPRKRLLSSYDAIFADELGGDVKEALEGKLFGLGSEEYVVGSNELYLGYAMSRKKLLCMDMGHYHPTETIHDKLSAAMMYLPELLLHVSRPIRWDSDHVVIMNDDLLSLAREVVRGGVLDRVYFATDFFDASINRVGAWTIGIRSFKKALLFALLEPVEMLRRFESENRGAERLALQEEAKTLPYAAVWNYFCLKSDVPVGPAWLNSMRDYENTVLSKR